MLVTFYHQETYSKERTTDCHWYKTCL